MELSNLKKSISDLNENELHSLLSTIRASRRTIRKSMSVSRETPTAKTSSRTLLDNISLEQATILLKLMEAQNDRS